MGEVGTEWQVAGVGGFDYPDTTDMLLRDTNNGRFELYDISNNNITGAFALGQVGPEWQVAGFGDFSGNTNETDMMLRATSGGDVDDFAVYDISNNQINPKGVITNVMYPSGTAANWTVAGFGDFSENGCDLEMMWLSGG